MRPPRGPVVPASVQEAGGGALESRDKNRNSQDSTIDRHPTDSRPARGIPSTGAGKASDVRFVSSKRRERLCRLSEASPARKATLGPTTPRGQGEGVDRSRRPGR